MASEEGTKESKSTIASQARAETNQEQMACQPHQDGTTTAEALPISPADSAARGGYGTPATNSVDMPNKGHPQPASDARSSSYPAALEENATGESAYGDKASQEEGGADGNDEGNESDEWSDVEGDEVHQLPKAVKAQFGNVSLHRGSQQKTE